MRHHHIWKSSQSVASEIIWFCSSSMQMQIRLLQRWSKTNLAKLTSTCGYILQKLLLSFGSIPEINGFMTDWLSVWCFGIYFYFTFTPSDTWSCPIWDLHLLYNVDTIFSWACHVFGLWISNIPRYFYFALYRAILCFDSCFFHNFKFQKFS